MSLLTKVFGTHSQRELKRIQPLLEQIEACEPRFKAMSDTELRGQTELFKGRLGAGETLDDLLPEAFAAAREAGVRVLGQRAFPVQLLGGIVLHQGRIAEMKTGEGKTLTAVMPSYLNALAGNGVHIVTVNSYLARYQSELMGKIFRFLGVSVGLVVQGISPEERRSAYACDVTYGTNNEFGFDYLRDNMALYSDNQVQRGHVFAIVDEVDSILIDEARTPLIISGQGEKSTDMYVRADTLASRMSVHRVTELDTKAEHDSIEADFVVDEKARSATLTPQGVKKAEQFFGIENLSDMENTTIYHHINQALRARGVMKRDIDYVVKDGEVIIVDEFTGRLMVGRRYSDGLHQAIEAKENVKVERESKTLATITFQNYFRLYAKLSGMTGTALTEAEEFSAIYRLDIIEIPTNRPMIREDLSDMVFQTQAGKYRAVVAQVKDCAERGQPVLVGTTSIEKSELISAMLKREGVKHNVLNAKHHDREAEIVAQAGQVGAVTIATNMAGRGTDIMLGGNAEFLARADMRKSRIPDEIIAEAVGISDTDNEEILAAREKYRELYKKHGEIIAGLSDKVRKAGGLFIIGTERHEARRIDNQLRGRSGRQGDPGASRFFLSLEDELMRLFAGSRADTIRNMMRGMGLDEDTPIEQRILSGAIENAQKRVESRNFQSRKYVLEYDDVMNKQRETIYAQRKKVLDGEDMRGYITAMIEELCAESVARAAGESVTLDDARLLEITMPFTGVFLRPGETLAAQSSVEGVRPEEAAEWLRERAMRVYEEKEAALGAPLMRELERVILLRAVDRKWMDHIDAMHELRQGIGLRAYAQSDPIVEYKREGFAMFEDMVMSIREDTVRGVYIARVQGASQPKRETVAGGMVESVGGDASDAKRRPVRKTAAQKIGRNDPCPCGSGKKYKKCCGFDQLTIDN
ncbi:MAG: preprotein translocase subunit SecA [Oscillospiraceae bacterium]|jgi:preprotein translocase subunit SecA|nr:preprotein translocase subunit SecA [Oscillospiraceae bacterium]